jgi:hypothetical protein
VVQKQLLLVEAERQVVLTALHQVVLLPLLGLLLQLVVVTVAVQVYFQQQVVQVAAGGVHKVAAVQYQVPAVHQDKVTLVELEQVAVIEVQVAAAVKVAQEVKDIMQVMQITAHFFFILRLSAAVAVAELH